MADQLGESHQGHPGPLARGEVEIVGYGRPSTLALAQRIRAVKAVGHPLDPVTVWSVQHSQLVGPSPVGHW